MFFRVLAVASCLFAASVAEAAGPLSFTPPACAGGTWACGGRESLAFNLPACPADRWVGVILSGAMICPAAALTPTGSWQVSQLFAPTTPSSPLARFCLYRWRPRNGAPPAIAALPNNPTIRLERDCRVVAPQVEFEPTAAQRLMNAYELAIARPDFGAHPPALSPVRIAVIDSSIEETTSGYPSGGGDGHGLVMASLARRNSCAQTNGGQVGCAFIANYRALDLGGPTGGGFGYQSDVARAMKRALDDWSASPQQHLVMNLSIGWDGQYGAEYGPNIRVPALSVWMIAQEAICRDVLVIAAAGNRSQLGGAVGPVFPAGWEPEPRTAFCSAAAGGYPPVLHAIGGVSHNDRPLSISRENSRPRLVAPAKFVTTDAIDPATGIAIGRTEALSGTSLAAAGVSGLAGLIWAMRPGWEPHEVIDWIYRQSIEIAPGADFQLPPWDWAVHRVDACTAARLLDPNVLPCTVRLPGADVTPPANFIVDHQYPGLRTGPPTPMTGWSVETMDPAEDILASPWVITQPGTSACPGCFITEGSLIGEVYTDGEWDVTGAFLRLDPCDPFSCDPESQGIAIEVPYNEPFHLELPEIDTSALKTAIFELHITKGGDKFVLSSEIYIEP